MGSISQRDTTNCIASLAIAQFVAQFVAQICQGGATTAQTVGRGWTEGMAMRLIDADVFDARLKCTYRYLQIAGDIAEAPTVDPIHATGRCYCRECKSLYKSIDPLNGHVSYRCSNPYGLQGFVLPHFYCVHGFMDKEEQTDDRE